MNPIFKAWNYGLTHGWIPLLRVVGSRLIKVRKKKRPFDEVELVFRVSERHPPGLMVDVGAHYGGSFERFLKAGWTVHAFEPDVSNRSKLMAKFSGYDCLVVDSRGVSNISKSGVPFYTSKVSSGISGMSSFHGSHISAGNIDIVDLATYMQEKLISEVEFLKIDTEGFDLFVLQGFPFEKSKPRYLVCEFEDRKSKPLGYTYKELAEFIKSCGYLVIVSEWFPIVEYGMTHEWMRLFIYLESDPDPQSWGNLIAFRDQSDFQFFTSYFSHLFKK